MRPVEGQASKVRFSAITEGDGYILNYIHLCKNSRPFLMFPSPDFVKYDCQSARVTVSVSNAGALNFRKEQYGNKIIVSRTIDNQGRSKVELKSEQGIMMIYFPSPKLKHYF